MKWRQGMAYGWSGALALLIVAGVVLAEPPPRREANRGGPTGPFHMEVPAHPFSLILGRPSGDSVTLSILASSDQEGFVRYGPASGACTNATAPRPFKAGVPAEVLLAGLEPGSSCRYQLWLRASTTEVFASLADGVFHTARPASEAFTFTVTADSHLDENTAPAVYAQTLRNALNDRPDFHVDLGDTFMTGKRRDRPEDALPQYLAQRYYFGRLAHSVPLFLVLGNHDGESGRSLDVATRMRTMYFPNPVPDGFYTGGTNGNYYAWRWGDACCIVLDPFRYSGRPQRGAEGSGWDFTLGRPQYDWLCRTLERSTARFTFVFTHHLVGGGDRQGRGGAEAVPYYEWGGHDADGREAFAEKRPGWPMPIHALLVKHGVKAVFHGHDHFFDKQEVDGIVYQLVPQPGHPGEGSVGQAADYGYASGDKRAGSGYLRVSVGQAEAVVEYVRTVLPAAGGSAPAGLVEHRYSVCTR